MAIDGSRHISSPHKTTNTGFCGKYNTGCVKIWQGLKNIQCKNHMISEYFPSIDKGDSAFFHLINSHILTIA